MSVLLVSAAHCFEASSLQAGTNLASAAYMHFALVFPLRLVRPGTTLLYPYRQRPRAHSRAICLDSYYF
eukprot:scaffold264111_cov15-Prasinocladus_malaysianus.AAC.1